MGAPGSASLLAEEVRRQLGPPPEIPDWPLVSIVVLNRDGADHLRRLMAGLVECTDYPNLELILVDNASQDDSIAYMRAVGAPFPVSILANPHNESFSEGCNQGAAQAVGELLLFLNNDAEPFEPGWLRELVACLRGSGAALAGPTLIEPSVDTARPHQYVIHQRGLRSREEGGVLITTYRDQGEDPLGDGLGQDTEVVALAGACLLTERAALEGAGGFSHGYWYGPEDVDLALKLRERGESVRCSGRSLLIHPPNSTLDTIDPDRRREWVRGNRRRFSEVWGPRVRREYELDRLQGGGLWAEPGATGSFSSSTTRAEVERLRFCIKRFSSPVAETGTEISPEVLAGALRQRGHGALVLHGAEVESLAAYDYDVAVHLGPCRYAPKPGQLNVLWLAGDAPAPPSIERSRYDVVLEDDSDSSTGSAGELALRLIEASDRLVATGNFNPRVEPSTRKTGYTST